MHWEDTNFDNFFKRRPKNQIKNIGLWKYFLRLNPHLKEQAKDFKLVGSDIDANAIELAKTNYPLIDFDVLGSPLPSKWIEMSNTKP